jgi:putative CocE/NonD family hydrolase
MTVISRFVGLIARLPPAESHDVAVDRNIPISMPDGVVLLADRHYPRRGGNRPTILVRSPYGRAAVWGLLFGQLFAERGFQVLIQSCRGTFGSGGEFDAFRNERADGLATLAWLREQAWFTGEFATCGPSYLGLVQYAVAAEAGPGLKAMVPQVTASEFRSLTYAGGSFGLDTSLTWLYELRHQEDSPIAALAGLLQLGAPPHDVRAAHNHLPLRETDGVATGRTVPFYQDWLLHNAPGDDWWQPADFSASVSAISAPVHLVGGWYDIFLPHTLADYARLREAGRLPYLTIGPWTHSHPGMMTTAIRESLQWFRAHLLGKTEVLRPAPVRLFVMGSKVWKDFAEWPPEGYPAQRWHLQPRRGLSPAQPPESQPDRYRYDPADPTPAVGGTSLSQNSGPRDNRALEARTDILTYSSDPLEQDLEVIGPVQAELVIKSSLGHTDFFARLCDVDEAGRSVNVCDGLFRLRPDRPSALADGTRRVTVDLWPTAHRFRRGHRLRLQVSSGAHPRFARNTGSGEPLGTATALVAADQAVYHDPEHPSALVLHARS